MTPRTDFLTACRVDLTLMLLPVIGVWEAAWTLAANEVPLEVAARVLALPMERRYYEYNPGKSSEATHGD